MNKLLFFGIFSFLATCYLLLGLKTSKKIKTTDDYFLAGRSLGLIHVTFTLVATQVGGGLLVGTSQDAYNIGFYGLAYTIGMSGGFLVLGLGIASRLRSLHIATTAELFETKYNSISLKKIASFLSMLSMWGILIAQIIGSKTLLSGLNIHNEWILLMFWLFVIAHTVIGGLHAVVMTDLAQVLFIIAVFGAIFIYCIFNNPTSLTLLPQAQSYFAVGQTGAAYLSATVLMPLLFSLIEQDLAQRFFAARTKNIAALSALCAGAILISIAFLPIYFGMNTRLLGLPVEAGSSPLIAIITHVASPFVLILAVCGIMAAITSTADSLLCAISSNLAQDFTFGILDKYNKVTLSQVMTFIIGSSALIASYFVSQNILQVMTSSYEISVSCLLVPLLFAYFKESVQKYAAFGAVACGLFGFIFFRMYPIILPKEIATLMLSLLGYLVGNYINRQPEQVTTKQLS